MYKKRHALSLSIIYVVQKKARHNYFDNLRRTKDDMKFEAEMFLWRDVIRSIFLVQNNTYEINLKGAP